MIRVQALAVSGYRNDLCKRRSPCQTQTDGAIPVQSRGNKSEGGAKPECGRTPKSPVPPSQGWRVMQILPVSKRGGLGFLDCSNFQ